MIKLTIQLHYLPLVVLLSGSLLAGGCAEKKAPRPDCRPYRAGLFYYHYQDAVARQSINIFRSDSIQVEVREATGDTAWFSIHWPDSCTYELRFIKATNAFAADLTEADKKRVVSTNILAGNRRYYLFQSSSKGTDLTLTDTMWLNKPLKSKTSILDHSLSQPRGKD